MSVAVSLKSLWWQEIQVMDSSMKYLLLSLRRKPLWEAECIVNYESLIRSKDRYLNRLDARSQFCNNFFNHCKQNITSTGKNRVKLLSRVSWPILQLSVFNIWSSSWSFLSSRLSFQFSRFLLFHKKFQMIGGRRWMKEWMKLKMNDTCFLSKSFSLSCYWCQKLCWENKYASKQTQGL